MGGLLGPEAENQDRPVRRRPLFPPDAVVPNPFALTVDEINDGYDSLIESGVKWKRLQAEKAAANARPSPPHAQKPTDHRRD